MRRAFVLMLILAGQLKAFAQEQGEGPKQPIAFNHKLHVTTLKQSCQMCHADTNLGEMVDTPDTAQCLQCHSAIVPKTQAEQKLAAFAQQNR